MRFTACKSRNTRAHIQPGSKSQPFFHSCLFSGSWQLDTHRGSWWLYEHIVLLFLLENDRLDYSLLPYRRHNILHWWPFDNMITCLTSCWISAALLWLKVERWQLKLYVLEVSTWSRCRPDSFQDVLTFLDGSLLTGKTPQTSSYSDPVVWHWWFGSLKYLKHNNRELL